MPREGHDSRLWHFLGIFTYIFNCVFWNKWDFLLLFLTLLLLNTTCPVLANNVDPDQLASEETNWSGSALFVIKYVNYYQKIKLSDWLEIRSGRGILIYSARQGLTFTTLLTNSADEKLTIFFLFSQKVFFDFSSKLPPKVIICLKCQRLLLGKIRKISFQMSSAENSTEHAER